jgi:hypothetical protein
MTREPTGPGCARHSGPGPSVTLSASASDAKGAARVDFYVGSQMVGTDSTAGGTSGQEYSASLNSTTLPDGPTTVVARAYDAAGNEKVSASRSMIVDNASPTGSVLINGGRASTTRLAARLNLEASDATSGTPFVRIANTSARLSTARWEPYAATKAWKLSARGSKIKTVFVQYRDEAGNVSVVASDTIRYRR